MIELELHLPNHDLAIKASFGPIGDVLGIYCKLNRARFLFLYG